MMQFDRVKTEFNSFLNNILKKKYISEELEKTINLYIENLEVGAELYEIVFKGNSVGFFISSSQTIPDFNDEAIKVLVVEVIETVPEVELDFPDFSLKFSHQIVKFAKQINLRNIEMIIERSNKWMITGLEAAQFSCVDVNMEKVLPKPNNVGDVLDLLHQTFTVPIIIQVLFQKGEDLMNEFMDTIEEVEMFINDGWTPFAVQVTFDTEEEDLSDILDKSDEILHWDDIVYNFSYR